MSLVACIQIPNLPIALARRDDPALRPRPLVLYAVRQQRAVVYAGSADTDIMPGMPLHQARVRCPHATYLLAEPERDRQIVTTLTKLLAAFSPRVAELQALPDVAIALDLGKQSSPEMIALVSRLAQRIRAELGLVVAIGVGGNRLVAYHAAMRAGAGVAVLVPVGAEAAFLAPQPISSLPLDAEILSRLDRLGLRTLGDLAQLPLDALQAQFGATGQRLHQLAHGIDLEPIPATTETPNISRTRRFSGPLLDRGMLERVIADLATHLATQLLADGCAAGAAQLTLTLDDGAPLVVERRLAEPTSNRESLAAAMLALCRSAALHSGVTAVNITLTDLVPTVAEQLDLFAPVSGQAQRLREVVSRLEGRFAGSLLQARLADPVALLPEQRVRLESR